MDVVRIGAIVAAQNQRKKKRSLEDKDFLVQETEEVIPVADTKESDLTDHSNIENNNREDQFPVKKSIIKKIKDAIEKILGETKTKTK